MLFRSILWSALFVIAPKAEVAGSAGSPTAAGGSATDYLSVIALAVGIGVNLASHPEGTEFPAVSVNAATGNAPEPGAALHRLAGRMAAWYEVWRIQGFQPVRDAWLARAACLGKEIRARLTNGEVTGVFEDMDGDGALIMRNADGVRRIVAADIFF